MTVVGFNFTKVNAEKKQAIKGKININNNVTIKNIEEIDLAFGKDQKGLKFRFEFIAKYDPEVASINLEGEVVYMIKVDEAKDILTMWKKEKKIAPGVMSKVLNTTLTKCNIQALILSNDLNLPAPIPLPKVGIKKDSTLLE